MKLSEKAAYVKGLIDGLELDPRDKQTKVFRQIADLLVEMAEEIGDLEQCYDDVCDQIDGIGEDLAGVEDMLYEDCGSMMDCCKAGNDDDLAYEATCPVCETVIGLSGDELNAGSIKCPKCGEMLEFDYDADELDSDDEEDSKGPEEE